MNETKTVATTNGADAARTEAHRSFATAFCGFVGSTVAATLVMVLLSSV